MYVYVYVYIYLYFFLRLFNDSGKKKKFSLFEARLEIIYFKGLHMNDVW